MTRARRKAIDMKTIGVKLAWALTAVARKTPPYRGYGVELEDRRFLSHGKDGIWRVFDSTDEAQQWAQRWRRRKAIDMSNLRNPVNMRPIMDGESDVVRQIHEMEKYMAEDTETITDLRAENNMLKGVLAERPEMRDVVGHLRALNAELQAGAYTAMRNRLADLLRRFDRES